VAKLACPFFQIYYSITKGKPVFTCQSLDLLINSPKNISFEKARKELGYEPRPLEQTLRDTLNWYIENKILN
jgi:dihydroflavonol-4-reductase